jgi:hypothetical protein
LGLGDFYGWRRVTVITARPSRFGYRTLQGIPAREVLLPD